MVSCLSLICWDYQDKLAWRSRHIGGQPITDITQIAKTDQRDILAAVEYCQNFHPEDMGNPNYLEGWHLGMCAAEALSEALDRVKFKELTPQTVEQYGVRQVSFDFEPIICP